jgi:HPr kinase/phosphorylase
MISLTVLDLLTEKTGRLDLKALNDPKKNRFASKKILIPQIQKPGLALTGHSFPLHPGRIQVLGRSEIDFLNGLPAEQCEKSLKKICLMDLACFVVTNNRKIPAALLKETQRRKIPLLRTSLTTERFVSRVARFLEERLTAGTSVHGVLVDVFGVGVLLTGKSGIGKSECGLELVMKGHRLVADDVVNIRKKPPAAIHGYGSDLIKYHMEIRGLGIINIKDLFGVTAVRDQKMVELIINIVEWDPKKEYERLGIDQQTHKILDVHIPFIELPVRPGRSLTTVIEVAARNHLLKLKGFHSAREFQEKLTRHLLLGGGEEGKTGLL